MAVLRSGPEATWLTPVLLGLDRLELLYVGLGLVGGLAVMVRALGRVRSVTARRQLRWIVWGTALGALPFVVSYVIPFVLGRAPWPRIEWLSLPLGLVPLAFAYAFALERSCIPAKPVFRAVVMLPLLAPSLLPAPALVRVVSTRTTGPTGSRSTCGWTTSPRSPVRAVQRQPPAVQRVADSARR